MVTVVDASSFVRDFGGTETLAKLGQMRDSTDARTLVELLTDQIEFANIVVVNKCDLVSTEQKNEVAAIIRALNPDAKLLYVQQGQVDPTEILNTGEFDFAQAEQSAGWYRELVMGQHVPETEEYGISSFVYRRRRPFHPARLHEFLNGSSLCGVYRAKGYVWIASRHDIAALLSQAGCSVELSPIGTWWACTPLEHWPEDEASFARIKSTFGPEYGDQRQEIVFIGGSAMSRQEIESALDTCLLTEDEYKLGPEGWKSLKDTLIPWVPVPPSE
jgi:G3E family GTPase